VRERSAQRVSRVRWPVQFRHTRTDATPLIRIRSTYTHKRETPSATPHAVPEQRRPVAFGSIVGPTPFHGSTIVHVLVCACTTTYTENNPVCVWVEWNREGVPERRDPGPKSWCATDFCVGVLPLRMNADDVCVIRVALSVSLLLHVRRSCDRHRMGVSPLSDPLTAVGIEAPALTANVSHIPGLEPVLRRSRPVLSSRWTARKSVSLTTGSPVFCAIRIHCRKIRRKICPGVDESADSSQLSSADFECLDCAGKRIFSARAHHEVNVDNSQKDEVRKQVVLRKDSIERIGIAYIADQEKTFLKVNKQSR